MCKRVVFAAVTFSITVVPSFARDVTEGSARAARQSAAESRLVPARGAENPVLLEQLIPIELTPPTPTYAIRFGAAYDSDEASTDTSNIPYEFKYTTAHANGSINYWIFTLASDGLERIVSPGQSTATGLTDQRIGITRPLGTPQIMGSVAYKLPTHGEVGSNDSSVAGKLAFWQDFDKWTITLIGGGTRSSNQTPGVSRNSMLGYLEVDYDLGNDKTFIFDFARVRKSGTLGATDLSVEYDFPFKTIGWDVGLSMTRGLVPTAYHTSLEIDFSRKF